MRKNLHFVFLISLAVLIGAACGVAGSYLYFIKPFIIANSRVTYTSAIAEAKFITVELELLHRGENGKLISLMDARLDDNLYTAASIEALSPDFNDKQIYDSISYIRSYRSKFPSKIPGDSVLDKFKYKVSAQVSGSDTPNTAFKRDALKRAP